MKTLIASCCIVQLCVACTCNSQDTTTTVVKDNSGNKVFVAHYQEIKDMIINLLKRILCTESYIYLNIWPF